MATRAFIPFAAAGASIAVLAIACAPIERSRRLDNPAIPARTIAQQVCSNCHGIDGNSVSPNFPRLAAQPQPYLVAQLTGFRNHHRQDPAGFEYMWGLSRHLTDAQIEGLAEYFSRQPPQANAPGDAALAAKGRDIFEHGLADKQVPPCGSCHGERGQGNATFPRLAGQHADYVVKQLMVFQRTDERPEGAVMKTVAHLLTRDDMVAAAQYVQSMPPR
jgi:cytochrome c553